MVDYSVTKNLWVIVTGNESISYEMNLYVMISYDNTHT